MKITTLTQKYGKYLATLIVGLVVGGFTMQMASASVPDASGTIHGCRNNLTTMLRVIDSASQSCGSDESGLNWDQSGVKGYARIVRNSNATYTLDTAHSKNVSNFFYGTSGEFHGPVCFTLSTTPHNVSVAAPGSVNVSLKDANGWTQSSACDSEGSGANVEVTPNNDAFSFYVTVF